jgi:hypothetical protein
VSTDWFAWRRILSPPFKCTDATQAKDSAAGGGCGQSPSPSDLQTVAASFPGRVGLAAQSCLAEQLRLSIPEITAELLREFNPETYVERLLVRGMARYAADMDLDGGIRQSVLRFCALQQSEIEALFASDESSAMDACITAAITGRPMERLERYRSSHERGFLRMLSRLRESQAERRASNARARFAGFRTERDCEEFLLDSREPWINACPVCMWGKGCWLARRAWECARCGHQVGLRYGTLMENSRLPLRIWFRAIGEVMADPTISAERLQYAVGLRRPCTVRKLLRRILAAMASPDGDRLLVRLQHLCASNVCHLK